MTTDTTTATGTAFEVGTTYECHWATAHDLTTPQTVVKRTARFVTLRDEHGETRRVGTHIDRGVEKCLPFGRYSMAPVCSADRPAS